jgi:DNA-binding transcriptional ArsR family regulator
MVSAELVGTLDAVRVTDWLDGVGISRSTAYELFKLLGIEPEARRVPGIRRPASHLNAEQMDALAPWVAEIKRGATLPAIRKTLGQNGNVLDASLGQNASVLDDQYGQNDNVLDSQSKLVAGSVERTAEIISAALTKYTASIPTPSSDPLRRAKALNEAADLGVALSTAEMADVLGMAVGTVRGLPDGHQPRPGFSLRRQKNGNAVWWHVERSGATGTVRAIEARPVGFAGAIEASYRTVSSHVELPMIR